MPFGAHGRLCRHTPAAGLEEGKIINASNAFSAHSDAMGLPVSVVISRTPAPGRADELVAWARGITAEAECFAGHLAAEVYPPEQTDRGDLVVAFTFSSADTLTAWEHSTERRRWLQQLDGLVIGDARTHAVSGFEGIFAHAPGQAVVPPPRWKTAAVIALALYPMSLLVSWLAAPRMADWNIFLRVLVTVAIIVPYMAWLGVPYLSRWLHAWLH